MDRPRRGLYREGVALPLERPGEGGGLGTEWWGLPADDPERGGGCPPGFLMKTICVIGKTQGNRQGNIIFLKGPN